MTTYIWRVKTRHPERFKQRCRVVEQQSRSRMTVEFEDGERITCRATDIATEAGTQNLFNKRPTEKALR